MWLQYSCQQKKKKKMQPNQVLSASKPQALMSIFAKLILTKLKLKRLQRMCLRLPKYPLKVAYKPGPQMFICDTLSRAALPLRRT